ncbi:hypothetical protein Bbelb_364190 [Branchiostoma belcheri]|nr:hypothetical protein Bbelb_364190 [Branchiostoma belcheri]
MEPPRPSATGYRHGDHKYLEGTQYSSRDKHQVKSLRAITQEFAGSPAGVCGISSGSLRDLLRDLSGFPAKPHIGSSGRLPGADRPRGVLARQSQRVDGDPPTSRAENSSWLTPQLTEVECFPPKETLPAMWEYFT